MSVVVCKLPKAGLGNQLFPLMKALVFARLNGFEIIVIGYHRLKPGPYLRGEKSKRKYTGYFKFEKGILGEYWDKWKVKRLIRKYAVECEPEITTIQKPGGANKIYIFEKMTNYPDYFQYLNEHRDLVISLLYENINIPLLNQLLKIDKPYIGVHIRMGDFRELKEGEEIGKVGTVRTPENYFVETIQSLRKVNGSDLPVNVFTNGFKKEFTQLFQLPNVEIIENNKDLLDLLLLSKSRIIVTSAGSTFSYWAAFLSEATIIMHPTYANIKIRPENLWNTFYEGSLDLQNNQFINAIKEISF